MGEISPDADAIIGMVTGTPAVTFGTSYVAGSASTLLRSDDQIKYPDKLMAPTDTSKRLEFTEDGVFAGILALSGWTRLEIDADSTVAFESLATNNSMSFGMDATSPLTGSVRNSLVPGSQVDEGLDFIAGATGLLGDFMFQSLGTCNSTSKSVVTVIVQPSVGTNQNFGLSPFFVDDAPAISARTVGCWNADMTLSGVWTGATVLVGYDHSTFNITPSAGSGAALNAYGARLRGPSISGTNATFTETATLTLLAGTGQTVTTAYGIKCQLPRSSTATQIGLDFANVAGGSTPTDRYGIRLGALTRGTNRYGLTIKADSTGTPTLNVGLDIEARTVGTTKYSIRTVTDPCSFGGDVTIGGALDHDGSTVGFYGITPAARSSAYTPTNVSADRSYDADSTTVDELADVLGTLISDLQTVGLIG